MSWGIEDLITIVSIVANIVGIWHLPESVRDVPSIEGGGWSL